MVAIEGEQDRKTRKTAVARERPRVLVEESFGRVRRWGGPTQLKGAAWTSLRAVFVLAVAALNIVRLPQAPGLEGRRARARHQARA